MTTIRVTVERLDDEGTTTETRGETVEISKDEDFTAASFRVALGVGLTIGDILEREFTVTVEEAE